MRETLHIICGPTEGTRERVVYPIAEVARLLNCSKRQVWRLARKGAFSVQRIDQVVTCVDASAVEDYLTRQAAES
jgi:hypothetical protein